MNGALPGMRPTRGGQEHPIDNLDRPIASDTVNTEVNADSYCCLLLDVAGRRRRGLRRSPATQGTGELAEMLSNIGPVAMAVLVLLLVASLYSWTVILSKISVFRKATKESRRVYPRLPQGHPAAGDCRADRRLQVQSRWRRFSMKFTRPTSGRRAARDRRAIWFRWSARRRPRPARPSPFWNGA